MVEEAVTGLMPSRPRANRRIGTSSEEASARGPRANWRFVASSEASARGLGEGALDKSEISAETSFVYSVGSVLRV